MKYVIYEYEEGIKQLFEKYPNLKQYFDNLTLDNDFMNKFINCVYNNVDYMNELIYKELHNIIELGKCIYLKMNLLMK